jgi:hypothetical protein
VELVRQLSSVLHQEGTYSGTIHTTLITNNTNATKQPPPTYLCSPTALPLWQWKLNRLGYCSPLYSGQRANNEQCTEAIRRWQPLAPSLTHCFFDQAGSTQARPQAKKKSVSCPEEAASSPPLPLSASPYAKSTPKLASNLRLDPSRSCRPHILHLLTTRKKTKKTPEYTSGRTVEACHTRGQKTRRKKKDFLSNGKHFFQKKKRLKAWIWVSRMLGVGPAAAAALS